MEELSRTNDLVLISFVEALLRDAGIEPFVMDQNMSAIEGSLGILPRRVLVGDDDIAEARQLLESAGIGGELERPVGEEVSVDAVATARAADRTVDAFLGGRVEAVQPAAGHHRAGLEAVLLAAALEAGFAGTVVDLGAGVGVAGMAVAARCGGANVILVERDAAALACAGEALARPANRRFAGRVRIVAADIAETGALPAEAGLGGGGADAVVANPPFNAPETTSPSPRPARASAHVLGEGGVENWLRAAAAILRPGGCLVVIFRADGLDTLLAATRLRFGAVDILPIEPRPGLPAHRILVRARKGSRAGLRLLPPLVLHGETGSAYLPPVEAILRGGAGLIDSHPAWRAINEPGGSR